MTIYGSHSALVKFLHPQAQAWSFGKASRAWSVFLSRQVFEVVIQDFRNPLDDPLYTVD
jgi:hypothetical protein